MTDVFLVAARRSAIGSFGGSLAGFRPGELAAETARAAIAAAGLDPDAIDNVVVGNVMPCEPRDAYVARICAVTAGIPKETPAMTVNRLCGSGMQAIVSAAQGILLGDHAVALAAGTEVMSRVPFIAPDVRWGRKMGDGTLQDGLLGALQDPFHRYHMGVTAENVAAAEGIDRETQDALALESQRRAAAAIADGRFREQIVPIEIKAKRSTAVFDTDEHVREDTTLDALQALRPAFQEGGTVTAGNASGLNDGAAAVVLANGDAVRAHGLAPLARLVAYGHAGVDPAVMGLGPIPASRAALARAGLNVDDLDVIESNEAFAAQACAVARALGFDPARTNPNGSGISLGHPVGATGAIIVTKLVFELARSRGRYGLATMCIGGGQGIATVWERC